jgi:transposase-like protein
MNGMPKTLVQAIRYFSDPQTCINAVALMRWEDGSPVCPYCAKAQDGKRNHYWLQSQKRWKCYGCRKQFSVKVGTIFEDSAIGLDKWMVALWMLCNCKNGVSSYEIARDLGITQKSAWFVLQRLRLVLKTENPPLMGRGIKNAVEIDETFVGGKFKNMHAKRRIALNVDNEQSDNKTAVMGMLTRDTREVRAKVIPNVRRDTLQAEILKNIEPWGTRIYTDQHTGYEGLEKTRFIHETVNHMKEYVRGNVHTQGIENFWSLLKRSLSGTYVAVEPFHLDRYLDEQCFRYNNRNNMDDSARFTKALSQVAGKRLTWNELTGQAVGSC